jgi:hypothetical protein
MLKKFGQEHFKQAGNRFSPVSMSTSAALRKIFVLCRSSGRMERENATLIRFVVRLEASLRNLSLQVERGKARESQKVEWRIGLLLEQNSRAASLFTVEVNETGAGKEASLHM